MNIEDVLGKYKFGFNSLIHVDNRQKPACRLPIEQVNHDSHLIHVLQGMANVYMGGEIYGVRRGSILLAPRFCGFIFREQSADLEMLNIHFELYSETNSFLDPADYLAVDFCPPDFNALEKKLFAMRQAYNGSDKEKLRAAALAHLYIVELFADYPSALRPHLEHNDQIRVVYDILCDPGYTRFSAEYLASQCFLSISQMNRRFSRIFGTSPLKFWEEKRFLRISREVIGSELNIGEISQMNGFNDIAYFSRWFKKMSGCMPLSYRNKYAGYQQV